MTISLSKSVWSSRERLLYAQLNAATAELLKCVDGTGGGTYTPSAVIAIGGSNGLRIEGTGAGANLRYNSRSVERSIPNVATALASTGWTLPDDPQVWGHGGSVAADRLRWPLTGLPYGGTLDTITIRLDGSGSKPTTMPTIRAYRVDHTTGTHTYLAAAATDASANDAAWQAAHDVTLSSLAHTIDNKENEYFVYITGCNGGGAFAVNGVKVSCTVTSQSEYNP